LANASDRGQVNAQLWVKCAMAICRITPGLEGDGSSLLNALANGNPEICGILHHWALSAQQPRAAIHYARLVTSNNRAHFESSVFKTMASNADDHNLMNSVLITLRETAVSGCATSQSCYALALTHGLGVKPNPVQAAEYFKMAADGGSPMGQFMSGINHMIGNGIRRDIGSAIFYLRAAANERPVARVYLALLLIGRTNLITRLQQQYQMELTNGSRLTERSEITSDVREAIEAVKHMAALTNPIVMYVYGFCIELGFGIERNPVLAVDRYREAVKMGNIDACYRFALCLRDGVGVQRHHPSAVLLLQTAADRGHLDAQFDLAMCLKFGCGCAINHLKSCEYLASAALGGNENAQIVVMASPDEFPPSIRDNFKTWRSMLIPNRNLNRDRNPRRLDERIFDLDRNGDESMTPIGHQTGWTRFFVSDD
jgi:TPR repeat protein